MDSGTSHAEPFHWQSNRISHASCVATNSQPSKHPRLKIQRQPSTSSHAISSFDAAQSGAGVPVVSDEDSGALVVVRVEPAVSAPLSVPPSSDPQATTVTRSVEGTLSVRIPRG
jgi:hypothetical protein